MSHTPGGDWEDTGTSGFRSSRLEEALTRVPLFQELGASDRERLSEAAKIRLFREGQLVFREGDPGRSLFLVLDGTVKMFTYDHQGDRILLMTLEADHSFGATGLLTGAPRTASVIAAEESLVAELPFAEIQGVLRNHPEIRRGLESLSQSRLDNSGDAKARAGARERRMHPRLNVELPVRFRVLPDPPGMAERVPEEPVEAVSADVSLGGVRLRVAETRALDLPTGATLRLEMALPEEAAPLRAEGVIRSRRPAGDSDAVFYGIAFQEMTLAEVARLKALIYGPGIL
jgi:CRP-like cAMP-binding protein